jgi:trehalose 6-phosphate synthase
MTKAGARGAHVVLLSDRGPVRFTGNVANIAPQLQSSSVTALLHSLATRATHSITWLTPSTSTADENAMRLGLFRELDAQLGYSPRVVLVDELEYDRYYYDVGINIIWSVWHGIEDDVPPRWNTQHPLASLTSYTHVNRRMAVKVAEAAAEGAVVVVQDYQFLLAPAMIRAKRPDVRIVHFSHVPFPDTSSLNKLPPVLVRAFVNGMLGADLLGFQCVRWADRFLRCCERLGLDVDQERWNVRHRNRRTWVRCYPVSVDVVSLKNRSRAPEVRRWAAQTAASDRVARIVRIDRLDPAKNALRGFEAYSMLLDRMPGLARDIRFVACLTPSRERFPDYQRYAARVRSVVHGINRRYPGAITVHYGNNQERAFGVLDGYDVLLVNPVADGMNLVAMEGPVLNTKDGTVILSSGAGAADLLSGAEILARPGDLAATADALEAALFLPPAKRRERAEQMQAAISRLDVAEWLERQVTDAMAVGAAAAPSCLPPVQTRLDDA